MVILALRAISSKSLTSLTKYPINNSSIVILHQYPHNLQGEPMKCATHNKIFHADDVCGTATCDLLGMITSLVRTRDYLTIKSADIVIDVGYVYDPDRGRYDHHQEGGAGSRSNGIPYASFGLVWKHYGEELCGSAEIAKIVDAHLVQAVDATDCGVDLYAKLVYEGAAPCTVSDILWNFNPDSDKQPTAQDFDNQFTLAVEMAKTIIKNEIRQAGGCLKANGIIAKAFQEANDRRVLVLNCFCSRRDWQEAAVKIETALFVIFPSESGQWSVQAVPVARGFSAVRRKFPAAWAGKRDRELSAITGVLGAFFCHNAGFVAMANSKEGALKLAELALQES